LTSGTVPFQSRIANDWPRPSRMNGSCREKASAASRVLKMPMLPRSANGPIPITSPLALNASTTALCRGYTAMICSIEAPDPSPMMTAFMCVSSATRPFYERVRFPRQITPRRASARHREPFFHQTPVPCIDRLPYFRPNQGGDPSRRQLHDERPLREEREELPAPFHPVGANRPPAGVPSVAEIPNDGRERGIVFEGPDEV